MEYIEEVTKHVKNGYLLVLKNLYFQSHQTQTMKHETVKNINSFWHRSLSAFFLHFER